MQRAIFTRISEAVKPMDAVDRTVMTKPLHHVDIPTKNATFAMACFWAPDALFGATPGVIRTKVGYSGGTKENPSYRNLGDHTEAIQIDYDPKMIQYETLLDIFWQNHDPTAKSKLQYTSFIFYHDQEQKELAEKALEQQQKLYSKPVVTVIRPATKFYDAEDYHQKYRLQQHPWLCEAISCKGSLLKTSYVAARLNGYVIGCGGVAQFESELPILGLDEKTGEYVRKLVTKYEGQGLVC
ncbi:peptide methionine sulfoxide reductase isoform X2 [Cimex lectularius]|uniref:peptide-methionine (S)-S-oxide reductase n=1 Tax=Cimex lectularius TaxID=79782 RepID=A0A8I6SV99_CIMLE|nr:peptide methionine sulfoxide reductase isoform X2 [Cimex lectularius]